MRALLVLLLLSCGAPEHGGITFCDGGGLVCTRRNEHGCTRWSCDVGEVRP